MTTEPIVARPENICPDCGALGWLVRYEPPNWSGDMSQPHQAEYHCLRCDLDWIEKRGYR